MSSEGFVRPPWGMDEFEAAVTAENAPAVCIVGRHVMRDLFTYLRDLEKRVEAAEAGEF